MREPLRPLFTLLRPKLIDDMMTWDFHELLHTIRHQAHFFDTFHLSRVRNAGLGIFLPGLQAFTARLALSMMDPSSAFPFRVNSAGTAESLDLRFATASAALTVARFCNTWI